MSDTNRFVNISKQRKLLHLNCNSLTREEMKNTLTQLMNSFREETHSQNTLFRELLQSSNNNPNYANITLAAQWTANEVCYWLISIGLQEYVKNFHSHFINGKILLSHTFNDDVLRTKLHISSLHSLKILQAIQQLKQTHKNTNNNLYKDEKRYSFENDINSLEKEIKNLKMKFENQLCVHKQSQEKTHLTHSSNIRAIKSIYEAQMESLQSAVEDKSSMIELLQQTVDDAYQSQNIELQKYKSRNIELQDGYIKLEKHYLQQLNDSRQKTKELELQIKNIKFMKSQDFPSLSASPSLIEHRERASMIEHKCTTVDIGFQMKFNVVVTDTEDIIIKNNKNGKIIIKNRTGTTFDSLKLENEELKHKLKNENKAKEMLESKIEMMTFEFNFEKQKRKLLESQTQRLTQELTNYLIPITYKSDIVVIMDDKKMEKKKIQEKEIISNTDGGWMRFLSFASFKTKNIVIPNLTKNKSQIDDEIYQASLMNSMSGSYSLSNSMMFNHRRTESNLSAYLNKGKKIGETVGKSVGSVRKRLSSIKVFKKGDNVDDDNGNNNIRDEDIMNHNQSFIDISDIFVFPV